MWGESKKEEILAALSSSHDCSKALAFSYGAHPWDVALLGKRPLDSQVQVLLQVGAAL